MTQFIPLTQRTEGIKQLTLFEVINSNHHSWLVQFLNKRLTAKWFYDYSTAFSYFKQNMKRNFK